VYVSIDTILEKLGYDWNTNKLPDKQGWEEIMNISYSESKNALLDSHNVLYDSTNHTKASREVLRTMSLEINASAQIIYIKVSPDSVRDRWKENKITNKRFVLDEKLLEITISALEIPDSSENPWIIEN
jgi:tRNA uridine 5-carbamoylmethylation protein Kti12